MLFEMIPVAARQLHDRIESAYGCTPQVIKKGDSIGFNIGGREAGRVEQVSTRDDRSTFYSPEKQLLVPVFA